MHVELLTLPGRPPRPPGSLPLVTPGTETFFGWAAGASATLLGLLFVAIQVSFGRFKYDPGNRRHAMARSTFGIYLTLFLSSLVFLWPDVDRSSVSIAVVLLSMFGATNVARTWVPVWRGMLREHQLDRLWQTAWLLVGPLVCYAVLAYDSYSQLRNPGRRIIELAVPGVILGLFSIATRNAWNLLVQQTDAQDKGSDTPD